MSAASSTPDHGEVKETIGYSSVKGCFSFLGAMALGAVLLVLGNWQLRFSSWIGWGLIVFGGLAIVFALGELRTVFSKAPVLLFTQQGLIDKRQDTDEQFIPWSRIRQVTVNQASVKYGTADTNIILHGPPAVPGRTAATPSPAILA